jgi:hypothetical protein
MNKFQGPGDPGFNAVAGQIEITLFEIRKGRPIDKADVWVRNKCYTADKLKIERLSGDLLPMDQCYINLSIVEQHGQREGRSEEGYAQRSSPFSLTARLKVETPDEDIQVTFPALFNAHK